MRVRTFQVLIDDEEGTIQVVTPSLATYECRAMYEALNFIRREAKYYTAPTSPIWKD